MKDRREIKNSGQTAPERDSLLIELFEERKKLANAELKVQRNQQTKLRDQPVLIRDDERLADLSHTIGCLTAGIYKADLIIGLLKMSRDEIFQYISLREETEKRNREQIEKLHSEVISNGKSKAG